MGRSKRLEMEHKKESQRGQPKLVQGGWEPAVGTGEVVDTDFKREPAFFSRRNKVLTSLGCLTQDIKIQLRKYTVFYIMYAEIAGRV